MSDQFWKMKSPVGYSSILLDNEMYTELTKAKQGLRIDGVPIQVILCHFYQLKITFETDYLSSVKVFSLKNDI